MDNNSGVTPELEEFLAVRRKKKSARHITGKASTGRMIEEVARATGYSRRVVGNVICVFLQIAYNHLINHMVVSLRWIGTFSFYKASARRVGEKKHIDENGKVTWDMRDMSPTCRVRFRPTEKLKKASRWYPPDELEDALEEEKEREKRFLDFLAKKGMDS